jgi:hypothetical protein
MIQTPKLAFSDLFQQQSDTDSCNLNLTGCSESGLQVPCSLAAACSKLISAQLQVAVTSTPHRTAPTVPSAEGSSEAFQLAEAALQFGAVKLAVLPMFLLLGPVLLGPDTHTTSQRTAACIDQVQRSGFLQLLPQLLVRTAEQLKAAQNSNSSSNPGTGSNSTTSISVVVGIFQLETCSMCLRLFRTLAEMWPAGVFVREVLSNCTEHLLQAALAVLQYSSRLAAQHRMEPLHGVASKPLVHELVQHCNTAITAIQYQCQAYEDIAFGAGRPASDSRRGQQ